MLQYFAQSLLLGHILGYSAGATGQWQRYTGTCWPKGLSL